MKASIIILNLPSLQCVKWFRILLTISNIELENSPLEKERKKMELGTLSLEKEEEGTIDGPGE